MIEITPLTRVVVERSDSRVGSKVEQSGQVLAGARLDVWTVGSL